MGWEILQNWQIRGCIVVLWLYMHQAEKTEKSGIQTMPK